MSNEHELLSKKQVMEQYGYPEDQLDNDLNHKKVLGFKQSPYGRWYIPRFSVEKRIQELARMGGVK